MVSRVLNLLPRESTHYGFVSFNIGFTKLGYAPVRSMKTPPVPGDIVVMWNRYGTNEQHAKRFEAAGAKVLIVENGYFGKTWRGSQWYALGRNHHNTFDPSSPTHPQRWASWDVELSPWHTSAESCKEIVVLAQRGIGELGIKSPTRWPVALLPESRIRKHPGKEPPAIGLVEDLKHARLAMTWASSAGLIALRLGVPVVYGYKKWIGCTAATHYDKFLFSSAGRTFDDAARLAMFERLAWHMWTRAEVESGEALRAVLLSDSGQ